MKIFKKLFFLYRSKAPLVIYLSFFKSKLTNIFFKAKIKEKKRHHKSFLIKKKITKDYFSSHANNFFEIAQKFKKFKYLEIGSFEGNSSMFISKNFNDAEVYCVDNWVGTEEYENINFSTLEKNFDHNVHEFNNIKKFKMLSDDFFRDNKIFFDIIYIDGYHKGSQVLSDFKNSWKILKNNGVIIFDDYIWKFYEKIEDNPCYCINLFIKKISNNIRIIKVSNSQLFIQKKM